MRAKVQYVAVVAIVSLAGAVGAGPASASRAIETSPAGAIAGSLIEGQRLFIAFQRQRIRCESRVRGTIAARTNKVRGEIAGSISEVAIFNCIEAIGMITIRPLGLPWNLTYEGFTGTLPDITAIRLSVPNARFLAEVRFIGTINCLFEGPLSVFIETRGQATQEFLIQGSLSQNREGELVTPSACREDIAFMTTEYDLNVIQRVRLVN